MTITILKAEAFQTLGPATRKEPFTAKPKEEWKPLREGYEQEVNSGQVRRSDYDRLQPRTMVMTFKLKHGLGRFSFKPKGNGTFTILDLSTQP